MKSIISLLLLSISAFGQAEVSSATIRGAVNAQSATGFIVRFGTSAPSSGDCDAAGERGNLYVQTGDPASVQTRVSICTQTGSSSYAWNPISHKVGTTAPAKCTTGELFFDSDATAGSNWFGCTSADTWTLLGGAGSITTIAAGSGIGVSGGTGPTATISADTAVMLSRVTQQAGTSNYCRSTTGNDTYTCSLTPTLTAYTRGGCIVLDADTANTGTATVNVDTLGAKSILNRAGSALSDGDITANKPITLCYDGTQYIIQGDGGGSTTPAFSTGIGYWAPFGLSHASSQITLDGTANTVYGFEFTAPMSMSVGNIFGFQVTDSAGKHFAFGICDAACTTMVATSSTVTSAANTAFTPTISASLSAGVTYNLLLTSDQSTATITMLSMAGATALYQVLNADGSHPRIFTCANNSSGTSTLTFNATCGSRTALSSKDPPLIVFAK